MVLKSYDFFPSEQQKRAPCPNFNHWVCGLSNILKYLKTLGLSTPCCPHDININ